VNISSRLLFCTQVRNETFESHVHLGICVISPSSSSSLCCYGRKVKQHSLLKAQLRLLSHLAVRYFLPAECSESFNLVLKIKIMLFSPLKCLEDCVPLKVRKNRVYKRMSCALQNIESSIRSHRSFSALHVGRHLSSCRLY
jgi:hypothetical protein